MLTRCEQDLAGNPEGVAFAGLHKFDARNPGWLAIAAILLEQVAKLLLLFFNPGGIRRARTQLLVLVFELAGASR